MTFRDAMISGEVPILRAGGAGAEGRAFFLGFVFFKFFREFWKCGEGCYCVAWFGENLRRHDFLVMLRDLCFASGLLWGGS